MAEQEAVAQQEVDDHHDEADLGYKVPAEKSLGEILKTDEDDQSLQKYKQTLLGSAAGQDVIVFPEDPRRVIVKELSLLVDGREDKTLDLTGDLTKLKEEKVVIKEKITYRLRISFIVQREIVTGLRYVQKVYRKGVRVDNPTYMVGSYAPKKEPHEFKTPEETAPDGMLGRGEYKIQSLFTDDDKHEYLKWEWILKVSKDWKDTEDTK